MDDREKLPRPENDQHSIYVDIHNDPSLLQLVLDTIPYMNGWDVCANAEPPNPGWKNYRHQTARYFHFSLTQRAFIWTQDDKIPPMGYAAKHIIHVKDAAHMSRILDRIYDYTRKHPKI